MDQAFSKSRFARIAALGLFFCMCYALFQPGPPYVSAVPLPDDSDVQWIDQTIRNHDLSWIHMNTILDSPLGLRGGTDTANEWKFSFKGKFTTSHLQDSLRALEYAQTQPADPEYESQWLETYQRPLSLVLRRDDDYVYLYCWENCPEVWAILLDYDPETQIWRWSDTVRYTVPEVSIAYSLYEILESTERIFEGADFVFKTYYEKSHPESVGPP